MRTGPEDPPLVAHLAATVSAQRARVEEVLARAERLDDERVLHDLRVALRRTAAVAKLTRAFPMRDSAEPLRRTARDLRRFLSPHRTLEVSAARLRVRFRRDPGRHAAALQLAARLQPAPDPQGDGRDGDVRLAALRAAFAIRAAELSRFSSPFAGVVASGADNRLARTVLRRLEKRRTRLLKGGVPDRESLHPTRIAAKDFRYGLEFVRGFVPGTGLLLASLRRFQDAAGDAHDRLELVGLVSRAAKTPAQRRSMGLLVPALSRDASRGLLAARREAETLLARIARIAIRWK
ncbi:MAG: CHAD domain-containing protein [Thermoanaerobaculia bacterium]